MNIAVINYATEELEILAFDEETSKYFVESKDYEEIFKALDFNYDEIAWMQIDDAIKITNVKNVNLVPDDIDLITTDSHVQKILV